MEGESSTTTLVLCGKSAEENEFALSLKCNKALKVQGSEEVLICLHTETESASSECDMFLIDTYMGALSTSRFGRFLIYSPRLGSTHDVVSHNFSELPIGSVCVADLQTKGRGRSKNVWESPKGCLMFSYTIQMEDGRVVPFVQYVVSLAITEAIKDLCQQNGIPRLDVRIKWPNDLYLDGHKVGGILCTSTYKSKKFHVSAGIGLNVANEKPTTCLNTAIEKSTSCDFQLKREDVMAAFFNNFEKLYEVFMEKGFEPLEELYYKTWLHSGQRVIVQDKNENQHQLIENVVTVQGLTSSGYLLAISVDGQICELQPDGNSFDFMKGLIRRKLA